MDTQRVETAATGVAVGATPWLTAAVELWTARALRRAGLGAKRALTFMSINGEVKGKWRKGRGPEGVSVEKYVTAVVKSLQKSPLFVFTEGAFLLSAEGEEAFAASLEQLQLGAPTEQPAGVASTAEPQAAAEEKAAPAPAPPPPPAAATPPAAPAAPAGPPALRVRLPAAPGLPSPAPPQLGPLESVLAGILPTAESVEGHAAALEALRSVITRAKAGGEGGSAEGATLSTYGSTVCRFDIRGSDLDVALQPPAAQLRAKHRKKAAKSVHLLTSFANMLLADARFPACLAAPLQVVTGARVPVVRVQLLQPRGEPPLRVEVTASSNGRNAFKPAVLGIVADALLPALRPLVRLVKAWARAWDLNEAFTGGLNSFALSLLCLFHCQCAGLLPPLAALLCDDAAGLMDEEAARAAAGSSQAGPLRLACDQLADHAPVKARAESLLLLAQRNSAEPPAQLLPLLSSFFEWWHSVMPRMSSGECVQPLTGRWVSAAALQARGHRRPSHLMVEDPFDAAENAARNLKRDSQEVLRLCAAVADAVAKLRAGHVDSLLTPPTDALLPQQRPALPSPPAAAAPPAPSVAASDVAAMEKAEAGDDHARFLLPLPWPLGSNATLDVRVPRPAGVAAALAWLVADAVGAHQPAAVLGLDVETDDCDDTALVQLSTATRCVLVRLCARAPQDAAASAAMRALCGLLNDPRVLKVGCELRADAVALLHDTGLRARLCGGLDVSPALCRPGAAGARGKVFGLVDAFNARHGTAVVKDRESTFSNWGDDTLSDAQMRYAALDAWMSYRLGCDKVLVRNPLALRVDLGGNLAKLADAGMLARRPRRALPARLVRK
jgi:hypothetical protein